MENASEWIKTAWQKRHTKVVCLLLLFGVALVAAIVSTAIIFGKTPTESATMERTTTSTSTTISTPTSTLQSLAPSTDDPRSTPSAVTDETFSKPTATSASLLPFETPPQRYPEPPDVI